MNMKTLRLGAIGALAALALGFGAVGAQAQLPDGQIRFIVDSGAGGGKDILARVIAEELGEKLGRSVIVESRPGAGGLVAGQAVASSPADGLTLLFTGMNSTISPFLYADIAFNPRTALTPVATVNALYFALVVNNDFPAQTLEEFNTYLRENPGEANVATAGSTTTLAAALYLQQNDLEHTFIAYPGSGPTINAMLSGEVDIFFSDVPSAQAAIENDQLRVIAISAPARSAMLPEAPTATEQGFADYVITSWYGLVAPAGTPQATLEQLNTAINAIVNDPEMKERMATLGSEPFANSLGEFNELYESELVRWEEVVRRGNIKP